MENKTLKIAIYSGKIPSTTFIERLISGLSEQGCTVHLFGTISKFTSYNRFVKNNGYRQNRVFKALYLFKYSVLLSLFKSSKKKQLQFYLKAEQRDDLYSKVKYYPVLYHEPDIFHLQWAKGIAEWFWVENFGIKLVLSLRGAHINYSPIADLELAEAYRKYFPKVSGFHAVSKAIAEEAKIYGAKPEKIKIVYSGLQLEHFKKEKQNKKQNQVYEIISVGRPHWIKGYHYALDACKILKSKGLIFKYTIVGGANDIELLYQRKDLDMQDEVMLLGQEPFKDIKSRIRSADLLLLPSVEEGIANVVLEAMALKTIVLSTDCGGMKEVITDGKNGFMVPIRSPKSIAEKIKLIISLTDDEKHRVRESALKTIQIQYAEDKMVKGMLSLYNQVLRLG